MIGKFAGGMCNTRDWLKRLVLFTCHKLALLVTKERLSRN